MRAWAVAKFSSIENKKVVLESFADIPFYDKETQIGKLFNVVPVKDLREINIIFPMKYKLKEMYNKKPLHYLRYNNYMSLIISSHLLGHEGPGSAFVYLKKLGWLTALSSGTMFNFSEQTFFSVEMQLTAEGENHVNEILDTIFQYVKLLRDSGVRKSIFEECQLLATASFKFMDNQDAFRTVTSMASNMQKYQPAHVISGPHLLHDYDSSVIASFLNNIDAANCIVYCIGKKYETDSNLLAERWYKTQYSVQPISAAVMQNWINPQVINPELHLPAQNEFIPTQFDLFPPHATPLPEHPTLLVKNDMVKCWYKQDDTFFQPKACLYFKISIPNTYSTPQNFLMVRLFALMIEEYVLRNDLFYFLVP